MKKKTYLQSLQQCLSSVELRIIEKHGRESKDRAGFGFTTGIYRSVTYLVDSALS